MSNVRTFHFFTKLPGELQAYIGQLSDKADLLHLAMTSKRQLSLFHNELFYRFMTNNRVIQIEGTTSSSFFLTVEGYVYVCGKNYNGELGIGDDASIPAPVRIRSLSNVKKVISLSGRTFFLTRDGRFWACGANSNYQLMLQHNRSCSYPQPVPNLPFIVDVKASNGSFFFLANNGSVYVAGENHAGRFGMEGERYISYPRAISGVSNIKRMVIGQQTAFFIDNEGSAYAIGRNDCGQLGLGHNRSVARPAKIPSASIKNIWAARDRVLIQTVEGNVFVCGKNDRGQLGVGTTSDCVSLTAIPQLSNIQSIYFNGNSTYAVAQEGKVYAWGGNAHGQLGLGDKRDRSQPTFIPGLSDVTGIEDDEAMTLFFVKQAPVYVCGTGVQALPGMEQGADECLAPAPIPSLQNICQAWNSDNIFTYLSHEGIVHGWGSNHSLALGLLDEDYRDITPIILPHIQDRIDNASPAELLLYAHRGNDFYHRLCFERALVKLACIDTLHEMQETLPLLDNERWKNNEILQSLFPGYELLGRDANLINAYARLLCLYKSLSGTSKSEIEQQRYFVQMLQDLSQEAEGGLSHHHDLVRFFPSKSPKAKPYQTFLKELRDISRQTLQQAADILVDYIPMPELPSRKRKAEDEPEDKEHQDKSKRLKKS